MHSVSQGVSVPIASASPVALKFATQSDVAWWAAAACTGRRRFTTALRGWPANQAAISTRKLHRCLGHLSARRVVLLGIINEVHFSAKFLYSIDLSCYVCSAALGHNSIKV